MKTLSGYVDDAYMTWLTSAVNCCGPLRDQSPTRGIEKPMTVLHESQPRLIPPPIFEAQERPSSRSQEWVDRTRSFASRASSRGSFSVRRKLNAYAGPRKDSKETRRTQSRLGAISAPTDFRHLQDSMPRRRSFRPLELSIYMPENQLSPILSHFGPMDDDPSFASTEPSYPPAALTHSRSESALSFSIPRKPIRSSSETSSEFSAKLRRAGSLNSEQLFATLEKDLPQAPAPARLREPPVYERVKSALHEKLELEQRLKDIEVIIEERQSIYSSSRPTSRMSASTRPFSIYQDNSEPMPTPPPVLQPSFAARVATPPLTQRPKTAPSKTVHIPARSKSFTEASAAFVNPSPPFQKPYNSNETNYTLPPPPPLPLILQQPSHPPLRKKKSFSRVSNWLFPSEHTRNISLDSVTNTPKPVTSRDGFYKCVVTSSDTPPSSPPQTNRTKRFSEITASTLESEIDEPTVTTTWTPDSSPGRERGRKMDRRQFPDEFSSPQTMTTISTYEPDRQEQSIELTRARTFGEREEVGDDERWRMGHGRGSVGVAF